ncbi:MAG: PEP-CTERM sorting domain-containing protein, partial [Candidatus Omnitrophica bacterium]|nr:PEP-CTERM sorting domain-containing protein [Candidatus Omnitrophota bacterium]
VPQETIPEPATMALLGMGGAALFYRRAKSKNQV